jgi:DNA-nicking Smr family endonuclease
VTAEEARIWRVVVQDTVPLRGRALPQAEAEAAPAVPLPSPAPPAPTRPTPPRPPPPVHRPTQPDLSHGTTPGLDRRSGERLKRGQLEIDGRLDLHGMTQEAAHGALLAFVGRAFDAGRRCLLVITGKGNRDGTGVLRAVVPRWLNQSPLRERIIGFSYAQARHGGEGALYVLVRRRRQ